MHTTDEPTGLSLKVQRVQGRIKAKDIASAMGVSTSRVSVIEGSAFPTPEVVKRYLDALRTCMHNRTSGAV